MTGALTALSPLLAAAAAKKSSGSPILLIFIVIGAAFYFLIYRPQQRKAKAVREQGNAFEVGDEVLTAGGIVGYVIDIDGDRVTLETSVGASFVVMRQYVLRKLEEPVAEDDEDESHDEHDDEGEHDHEGDHDEADSASEPGTSDEHDGAEGQDGTAPEDHEPTNGTSGPTGKRPSTDGSDDSGGHGVDGPPII
jgi:preprotein translocase subunit YajC